MAFRFLIRISLLATLSSCDKFRSDDMTSAGTYMDYQTTNSLEGRDGWYPPLTVSYPDRSGSDFYGGTETDPVSRLLVLSAMVRKNHIFVKGICKGVDVQEARFSHVQKRNLQSLGCGSARILSKTALKFEH